MKLRPSVLSGALILAVLSLTPADMFSCGPFFTETVFVSKRQPTISSADYLAGHLGVVQPTYHPVYLAIAYRVLSGMPIDRAEIEQAQKYWDMGPSGLEDPTQGWPVAADGTPLLAAVSYRPQTFPVYRRLPDGYGSFLNCTPDAFRNATATLQDRAQRFGAQSATMQDWMRAQDAVFSNCGKDDQVPAAAPSDADALIKADRAYQIAAAHFYREDFDDARAGFLEIAKDEGSPWRTIAPYLAARTLIRQATLATPGDKPPDPKLLAQADAELRAILENPAAKDLHPAVLRTLGFVEFRLSPEERLHTLALQISGQQPTVDLGQDLIDYTRLLDDFQIQPAVAGVQPAVTPKVGDDLTDWIVTASAPADPKTRAHAMERWQQAKALPWLVAALVKTNAGDPGIDMLLTAAAAVPDNSPGRDSVTYQRARLLMATQKNNEARSLVDRELARAPAPPNQTRNLYTAMRWQLAQNFDEFLKFAPQVPLGFDNGDDYGCYHDLCGLEPGPPDGAKGAALFDGPVSVAFNRRLPLQLLSQAAQGNALPKNLQQDLLVVTWSRAALLGDSAQANALGKQLGQQRPSTLKFMEDYAAAQDAGSREFAAVFAMLHLPGVNPQVNGGVLRATPLERIDDYRDNWWCGLPASDAKAPWPTFLSEKQRGVAEAEWNRLNEVGTAPSYFGKVVLAWAKSHPDDPRVPEALHFVVRSTRYGCSNAGSGEFSRKSFQLLHDRYAASEWTKQTPLWFK